MRRSDLFPLSVFFLDRDPRQAARALSDLHIQSQGCALQRELWQIALLGRTALEGYPGDPYAERPLTLAGCWAVAPPWVCTEPSFAIWPPSPATIDQRDGQIVAALGLLAALLHEYDQPDTSDGPEADALWARARVLVGGER